MKINPDDGQQQPSHEPVPVMDPSTAGNEKTTCKELQPDDAVKTTSDGQQDKDNNNQLSENEKIRAAQEFDAVSKLINPISRLFVRFPIPIGILVNAVVIFSAILAVIQSTGAKDLPDFSEPTKGLEARGTPISAKVKSYENFEEIIRQQNGMLKTYQEYIWASQSQNKQSTTSMPTSTTSKSSSSSSMLTSTNSSVTTGKQISSVGTETTQPLSKGGSFCNNGQDISRYLNRRDALTLVYEHEDKKNLLTVSAMLAICRLHDENIQPAPMYWFNNNCKSLHLPNYIALYSNKTSCSKISDMDIKNFFSMLSK